VLPETHIQNAQTQEQTHMNSNFSSRLSEAMKSMGFTQERLAEKLGISHSAVSRWTSGSLPRTARMAELARILCVPVSWLESGGESLFPAAATRVCEDEVSYGAKPFYLGEILKLAESADLSSILDTMEALSQSASSGNRDASATIAQMIPIVRRRLETITQNQSQ
jgi:transcriptional regulator with XRE-family HTH domain